MLEGRRGRGTQAREERKVGEENIHLGTSQNARGNHNQKTENIYKIDQDGPKDKRTKKRLERRCLTARERKREKGSLLCVCVLA